MSAAQPLLVTIDVSGTLLHYSETVAATAYEAVAARIEAVVGISIDPLELVTEIHAGFGDYDAWRQSSHQELQESDAYSGFILPRLHIPATVQSAAAVATIWREEVLSFQPGVSDLARLIAELRSRGVQFVAAISDMLGPAASHGLAHLGLGKHLDFHFCSSRVGVRKTGTTESLYHRISSALGISPHLAVHIGNDEDSDTRAAIRAGWGHAISLGPSVHQHGHWHSIDLDRLTDDLVNDRIAWWAPLSEPFSRATAAHPSGFASSETAFAIRQAAKRIPDRRARENVYRDSLIGHLGIRTRLGLDLEIRHPENLYIGENSQLGDQITILNEAPVIIGSHVMLALGVFISTYKHHWRLGLVEGEDVESWSRGSTVIEPVSIEDHVWIGPYVTIEAGSFIGHHSVIGANSLVQRGSYPPYSMLAGSPARVVRSLRQESTDLRDALLRT